MTNAKSHPGVESELNTKLITEGKMTSSSVPLRRAVTLALAVSGAMMCGHSWAADADQANANAEGSAELEEIIVTAEKRSENIQDVPISVIAVSAQALQDAGVKDIKDLQTLTP